MGGQCTIHPLARCALVTNTCQRCAHFEVVTPVHTTKKYLQAFRTCNLCIDLFRASYQPSALVMNNLGAMRGQCEHVSRQGALSTAVSAYLACAHTAALFTRA